MDDDARKAISYVKVAMIIIAFLFTVFLLTAVYLLATSTVISSAAPFNTTLTGSYVVFLAAVELFWLLVVYRFIYKRLQSGKIRESEVVCLIVGVFQLLFGGIISGIVLLVAWIKIRDSVKIQSMIEPESFQ